MLKQLRVIGTATAVAGLVLAGAMAAAASPPGTVKPGGSAPGAETHKVTICHATNSNTNPYVEITVDVASILNKNGHSGHDTLAVWSSTLKSSHAKWGDIIPPFSYLPSFSDSEEPESFDGLNWTDAKTDQPGGQDIWEAGCKYEPAPVTF